MRWRELKNRKQPTDTPKELPITYAPITMRIKAYITDMFMIYIPLLYILTYLVLDGKEAFQSSQWAPLAGLLVYALIDAIFTAVSGQTPGKKAYEIKVVDLTTQKKISFLRALWRFSVFIILSSLIFTLLVPFFRKDRRALHDMLTHTVLIPTKRP